MKVSKVVKGEVKEVEVGVVNSHLGTWYSDTEAKWSQVLKSEALFTNCFCKELVERL